MPKINFSYENQEERREFMGLIDPLLRNARIRENYNSKRYNHIYITYENPGKKPEKD